MEHYRRLSVIFRPLELQQMQQFPCFRGHPSILFNCRGTVVAPPPFKSTGGQPYRFSLLLELAMFVKNLSLNSVVEVFVSHLSYFNCIFTCACHAAAGLLIVYPFSTDVHVTFRKTLFITDSTFPDNLAG